MTGEEAMSGKETEYSPGKNYEDISSVNKSSIIKFLRRSGVCSRSQISKAMGLTQASISKIIAQLIEENIVYETGYITGEKGRRSIGVALNTHCKKVLGVRISRRSFAIGLFDLGGQMYESVAGQFTAETTLHDVIGRIRRSLNNYLEQYPDIASIGVAVPGPFNQRTSEIILTTSMATADWTNTNLRLQFGEFPVPIAFSHDADAGALADWWFGSRVSELGTSLVHFLVGDGVGAGHVVDGEFASQAGFSREMGHISINVDGPVCLCGNRGCLELYCSTFAFMKMVEDELPMHPGSALARLINLNPRDVFSAARADDSFAVSCVRRLGRYIGYGVVNIIYAYEPDIVIISNEMARGGKLLLDQIREVVKQRIPTVIYRKVSIQLEDDWLMNDPVLYGAAAVAVGHCMESPVMLLGNNAGH